MIKTPIYLIFISNFACFDWWRKYTTSVYANNFLYVYDTFNNDTKSPGITKYQLKEGPIKGLKKEYFNLGDETIRSSPQFFSIPDDFKKKFPNGDKAWMLTCDNGSYSTSMGVSHPHAQMKFVDDNEKVLKFMTEVANPRSPNMTQNAYSVNGVKEGDNFSIYVYGGISKNPNYKNLVVTNTFHKYDLKKNEWKDLSYKSPHQQTAAFHKMINVDDKYLLMLGGIYIFSDHVEEPVMQNNYTMYYYNFEKLRRYSISKEDWDTVNTSTSVSFPIDLKAGKYGFSATYHEGKVYIYGGITSENKPGNKGAAEDKEKNSPYLGILDTNTYNWEWFHPTNSKGEKVSRGLAFHDSMIWNNQLILTHGGIADSDYKYQVHAIDLDTKQFSEYIGPTPFSSSESTGFPLWATIVIVVVVAIVILMIIYYIYRKRRQSRSRNGSSAQNLQEIWATPQNAIVNTRSAENTGTGLTGNTATNQTPLNTDIDGGVTGANNSRMTRFYMDLPYFQHEVDTHDTQIDFLAKEQPNQLPK